MGKSPTKQLHNLLSNIYTEEELVAEKEKFKAQGIEHETRAEEIMKMIRVKLDELKEKES